MIALVDCNNFFASCERAFNPKLKDKPVVILSSNDGCVISRSSEAKKYIPMGAPAYQYEEEFNKHGIAVLSANFTLYADMSNRINKITRQYVADIETYSIDESFFNLKGIPGDYVERCRALRKEVLKSTGIPVSIGIAPTKTLAKICNHYAKDNKDTQGVFLWSHLSNKDEFLKKLPVEHVWNVGYKISKQLNESGIYNTYQLKTADSTWIRKAFSVNTLRTVTELNEIPCFELENSNGPRRNIMSSQSFGKSVTTLNELEEAVSTYTTRAWDKLMEQKSACGYVSVGIRTSYHKDMGFYSNYYTQALEVSTWYLPDLIAAGLKALKNIYKPGFNYKKASVFLLGITARDQVNLNLLNTDYNYKKYNKLMSVVEKINNENGSEFIKYASVGIQKKWRAKSEKRSQAYTTKWSELLTIN